MSQLRCAVGVQHILLHDTAPQDHSGFVWLQQAASVPSGLSNAIQSRLPMICIRPEGLCFPTLTLRI